MQDLDVLVHFQLHIYSTFSKVLFIVEEIKIESMTVKQLREKKTSGTKNHFLKLAKLFKNHEEDKENDVHALDFKFLNLNYCPNVSRTNSLDEREQSLTLPSC